MCLVSLILLWNEFIWSLKWRTIIPLSNTFILCLPARKARKSLPTALQIRIVILQWFMPPWGSITLVYTDVEPWFVQNGVYFVQWFHTLDPISWNTTTKKFPFKFYSVKMPAMKMSRQNRYFTEKSLATPDNKRVSKLCKRHFIMYG